MIGYCSLLLSLLFTCIAAVFYCNLHWAKTRHLKAESRRNWGLPCYRLAAAFVGLAAGYLLYIILDNRFDYAYVFSYSSRELAWPYKISAFWAGQQGSFMLWLLFHVIFGLFLSRRKGAPAGVMGIYSGLQAMLLMVLLVKSPFMLLSHPQVDGVGLNPLLQDVWMIIHPPIIFLGYAGLAIPFAYALEGLAANNHKTWTTAALPWALFSWCALGAGIFIGGFWAYKVLGWGGYWSWDPVENSSLVPWLVAGVLVHSLFWARSKLGALKGAYLASIFSLVTVLYGTFLTRSGILSEFSTHSFADEGIGGLLAMFVLVTLFCSLVLLIIRWPVLPNSSLYSSINSREFMLGCSVLVLTVMSVAVSIGMSTPLITMLMGYPSNVSENFYNQTSLPLAAALVILLTGLPLVNNHANRAAKARPQWWLAAIGLLSVTLSFKLRVYHPMILGTIVFSVMALLMNMLMVWRNKSLSWPAATAHTGLAILILGILVSSAGSQSVMVTLDEQQSKNVFARTITYLGTKQASDGRGFYHEFIIEGPESQQSVIRPFTKYNKAGRPSAREPGIHRGWFADLYVVPVSQLEDPVIAAKPSSVEAEISHKPFVSLVWLGGVLITVGSGWAAVNRFILPKQVLPNKQSQHLTGRV